MTMGAFMDETKKLSNMDLVTEISAAISHIHKTIDSWGLLPEGKARVLDAIALMGALTAKEFEAAELNGSDITDQLTIRLENIRELRRNASLAIQEAQKANWLPEWLRMAENTPGPAQTASEADFEASHTPTPKPILN